MPPVGGLRGTVRVLWFTHAPLAIACEAAGLPPQGSGYWVDALAEALAARGEVELAVVSHADGSVRSERLQLAGITHYILPLPDRQASRKEPQGEFIKGCQRAVEEFKPDLIHIHGTEKSYGLLSARGHLRQPVVVSIQGLLQRLGPRLFAELSWRELLLSHSWREWKRLEGPIPQRLRMVQRARMEREIIAGNQAFIGATDWDQAFVRVLNPSARYVRIDPLARPEFARAAWSPEAAVPKTIFTAMAAYPAKGLHVLIKATALLKREFPDVELRIAGTLSPSSPGAPGYHRLLERLIRQLGLEKNVRILGFLSADNMARELSRAWLTAVPSFDENWSTTLVEALLVGTPTVVSYAGGMPSVAEEGRLALFFLPGDEAHLAEQLRRLLLDPALCRRLSESARPSALERYADTARATGKLMEAYRELVAGAGRSASAR
jgi:L-malate glycosyltransferase